MPRSLDRMRRLKAEVQHCYVDGPQGMSAQAMRPKRRQQRKAAAIDDLHTLFGARLLGAAGRAGDQARHKRLEAQFSALLEQTVLFEQHRHAQLDPQGRFRRRSKSTLLVSLMSL